MNETDKDVLYQLQEVVPIELISVKDVPGQGSQPFISHDTLTAYLFNIDPTISWYATRERHFTRTDMRYNKETKQREPVEVSVCEVYMEMNVQGVVRGDYGTGEGDAYGGPIHKAYAAALSRAAMRFGVGIELWRDPKGVLAAKQKQGKQPARKQAPQPEQPAASVDDRAWDERINDNVPLNTMSKKQATFIKDNLADKLGIAFPHMISRAMKRYPGHKNWTEIFEQADDTLTWGAFLDTMQQETFDYGDTDEV